MMKGKVKLVLSLILVCSVQLSFAQKSIKSTDKIHDLKPLEIKNQIDSPCPVGAATNPSPADGAINVPITQVFLGWTNGSGTVNVELWFGQQGNIVKVYDGLAISSWPTTGWLNYETTYQWKVVCKNDTCSTWGPTWSFTTVQEPFPGYWCDEFNNFDNWTIIGPFGLLNWYEFPTSNAGGTPPELMMSWTPAFNGESKIRSNYIPLDANQCCEFTFNFFFDWYADPSGSVTVGITYDGGATDTILYLVDNPTQNVGPTLVSRYFKSPSSDSQNCQIEITYSGNSFNTDNIYWDNMCIAYLLSSCDPPVAPTNLTAQVIYNPNVQVQLNWQDNSWNEYGFRVFRKFGDPNDPGDYSLIGTTQNNVSQFIDATVLPESTYTYRVFAYGQYGQNGSNTATISVPVPVELISFTAEGDNNIVTLLWQTATETNNQGFEIERLQDSKIEKLQSWERIGFVEGNGTTTKLHSYSFTDKPEPGKYKYRLKQIDYDGTFAYSSEIEAEVKAPNVFSLEQNYPNPFNPTTKIKYTIPGVETRHASSLQMVTLKIYDILGNEVATLVNEEQAPSTYEVEFNSVRTSQDLSLPSGIYFYQLKAGNYIETKKMILLK